MLNFYIPKLTAQLKLTRTNCHDVIEEAENVLKPSLSEESSSTIFEMKENEDNTFSCQLFATGSFLSNVQIGAKENNFQEILFNYAIPSHISEDKDEDEDEDEDENNNVNQETLIMSGQCSAETQKSLKDKLPFALKIATTFGLVTAMVKQIISPPSPLPPDARQCETIATLLQKSLLRCISISSMVKDNKNDDLKMKLMGLTSLTGFGTQFMNLLDREKAFYSKKSIAEVAQGMLKHLGTLRHKNKSKVWEAMTLAHKLELKLSTVLFPVYTLKTIGHMLVALNLEREYLKGLRKFYHSMQDKYMPRLSDDLQCLEREVNRLNVDETEDIRKQKARDWKEGCPKEASIRLQKIIDKRNNNRIVLYEKLLNKLTLECGLYEAGSPLCSYAKRDKLNTLSIYQTITSIRETYSKQFFVGFVGPQNAGKSTLMNKLFHTEAKTGMLTHTTEMTTYPVAENVFAIDFPGSNSVDIEHKKFFSEYGQLADLFIVVNQYNGSVDATLIENVKAAYSLRRQAGLSTKTLFCLNKCSSFIEEGAEHKFDDAFKKNFVDIIRKDVEEKDFTQQETVLKSFKAKLQDKVARTVASEMHADIVAVSKELKEYTIENLHEKDFLFTDWINGNTSLGIYGPEEVWKRIAEYAGLAEG